MGIKVKFGSNNEKKETLTNRSIQKNNPINSNEVLEKAMSPYRKFVHEVRLMNGISDEVKANIIVARIRYIYISTCATEDVFDIEALNYMDKILFDNLIKLIVSIIKYGSKSIDKEIVKNFISHCIGIVEYTTDIITIHTIIDELFEEFE